MQGNEITIVLNGQTRDYFLDVEFPEFNGTDVKVTLDLVQAQGNVVPFRYKDGVDYFIEGTEFAPTTMMCVFKLGGDDITVDDQMKVIGKWTHDLNLDPAKYHVSMRMLSNETTQRPRTFIYRIYANNGECEEHPEMLAGAPIGMYRCPVCLFMVIAGLPHPTKAQVAEFNAETGEPTGKMEDEETSAWEPALHECESEPYTAEQLEILNADLLRETDRKQKFDSMFGACQVAFLHYQKLEDDWDGNGCLKPQPEYMETAFNFLMFVSDHADFDKTREAKPMLDHEGVPGIFWPSVDGKNYVSLAFYGDQIVYFIKDPAEANGTSGTLQLGTNIEPTLMNLINVWPNQDGVS